MDDPSENKIEPPGEQNPNEGFSFMDMLDLSPQMRIIVRLLIPTTDMAYIRLCEAIEALPEAERFSQAELDNVLSQMTERGFIVKNMIGGQIIYKVMMGRRKTRTNTLDKEIWDTLGWDEDT